ncbi:MAG: hypothetical protein JWO75_5809, partial [Actinomycetia bacterium]|nr:hypothetical protein [Actinomycetes bacterium]
VFAQFKLVDRRNLKLGHELKRVHRLVEQFIERVEQQLIQQWSPAV